MLPRGFQWYCTKAKTSLRQWPRICCTVEREVQDVEIGRESRSRFRRQSGRVPPTTNIIGTPYLAFIPFRPRGPTCSDVGIRMYRCSQDNRNIYKSTNNNDCIDIAPPGVYKHSTPAPAACTLMQCYFVLMHSYHSYLKIPHLGP